MFEAIFNKYVTINPPQHILAYSYTGRKKPAKPVIPDQNVYSRAVLTNTTYQ